MTGVGLSFARRPPYAPIAWAAWSSDMMKMMLGLSADPPAALLTDGSVSAAAPNPIAFTKSRRACTLLASIESAFAKLVQ